MGKLKQQPLNTLNFTIQRKYIMKNYTISYFIEFNNLTLNFSNTYYNTVNFMFNNIKYRWLVVLNNDNLYLYDPQKMLLQTIANTPLHHNNFDFALFNNTVKTTSITSSNLFTQFQLAILTKV